MEKIKSYLRFPSKAPFAWLVYYLLFSILYRLYTVLINYQNSNLIRIMLQLMVIVSNLLLIMTGIQGLVNVVRIIKNEERLSAKKIIITALLLLGIFFIFNPLINNFTDFLIDKLIRKNYRDKDVKDIQIPTVPSAYISPSPIPTTAHFYQPPNSELLGKNDGYVVYLSNPRPLEFAGDRSGQLQIFKKPSITPIVITKPVNIHGSVIITNDSSGKYLSLSLGSSPTRSIIIVNLLTSQVIEPVFCAVDPILFWQDTVYFGNCDYLNKNAIFDGPLSGISERNLKTNTTTTIFKSNRQTYFVLKKIQDNKLYYSKYQYANGSNIATDLSYDLPPQ